MGGARLTATQRCDPGRRAARSPSALELWGGHRERPSCLWTGELSLLGRWAALAMPVLLRLSACLWQSGCCVGSCSKLKALPRGVPALLWVHAARRLVEEPEWGQTTRRAAHRGSSRPGSCHALLAARICSSLFLPPPCWSQ